MNNLADFKNFECFKVIEGSDFFYTVETFVDKKGFLFQNCKCGKCSDCFRTKNNLKFKIGHIDTVTEATFEE